MESIKNLVEYYDELHPVTLAQQTFYETMTQQFPHPAKLLSIGCGTGALCHRLAKDAVDVTGLETQRELLESANLAFFPNVNAGNGALFGKKVLQHNFVHKQPRDFHT